MVGSWILKEERLSFGMNGSALLSLTRVISGVTSYCSQGGVCRVLYVDCCL